MISNLTEALLIASQEKDVERNHKEDKVIQHILFVDDDDDDFFLFKQAMNDIKGNFVIHHAPDGDRMFMMLEERMPDIIFLDLHMPGKSGITCLKMLRHHHNTYPIPVVIYSRLSNKSLIDECYQAKANYFIIKPVTLAKLTSAIKRVLATNWNGDVYPLKENFIIY